MRLHALPFFAVALLGCASSAEMHANVAMHAGAEFEKAPAPKSTPDTTTPADAVAITYAPPKVGTRVTIRTEQDSSGHVNGPWNRNVIVRRFAERVEESLDVSGDRQTKVKVTFVGDATTVVVGNGKPRVSTHPLVGKTYVVEMGVVRPRVFASEGVPASPATSAMVSMYYRRLGIDDEFANGGFPTGAMVPGARVPSIERTIAWTLARLNPGAADIRNLAVTFVETQDSSSGRVAVFAIDLNWSVSPKGASYAIGSLLRGTMTCRLADGQPTSLVLEGPTVLEGSFGHAEGNDRIKVTYTYG